MQSMLGTRKLIFFSSAYYNDILSLSPMNFHYYMSEINLLNFLLISLFGFTVYKNYLLTVNTQIMCLFRENSWYVWIYLTINQSIYR